MQIKTTKLRGIQELRRETWIPLLFYSGSKAEAAHVLGTLIPKIKKAASLF